MFRTIATVAILALTVTAAQAGETVTVRIGDLDLVRPGDMQVLVGRVHAAAESFCTSGGQDHPYLPEDQTKQERCIAGMSKTLWAKAMPMFGDRAQLAAK